MKLTSLFILPVICVFSNSYESTATTFTTKNDTLTNVSDLKIPESEKASKWNIESDFNSNYIWHGILFQDAFTWNPSVSFSHKNFSANGWTNFPVYFYNSENKSTQDFKELDLNLNYEIEKEISYTMITHSAQIYTPLGQGDWYWGMINIFQGFYKGPIGVYINPEVNYYPYAGGLYIESGFNYNYECDNAEAAVYLSYANSNKIFTEYNICGSEDGIYLNSFQNIKLEASYQYNTNSVFIRPHFSYYHLLNYSGVTGYKNNFSFGLAVGLR